MKRKRKSKSRGGRYARCGGRVRVVVVVVVDMLVAGPTALPEWPAVLPGVASGRRQRSVRRPEAEDSRRVWFRGYRA